MALWKFCQVLRAIPKDLFISNPNIKENETSFSVKNTDNPYEYNPVCSKNKEYVFFREITIFISQFK